MLNFISIEFFLLFTAFFLVYWLFAAKPKIQNTLLIAISYAIVYFMSNITAMAVLLIFTIFIFIISIGLTNSTHPKRWLISGILLTVLHLSFWKYTDFFRMPIIHTLHTLHLRDTWLAEIVLPLGISYYSFQAISYLTDLYNSKKTASDNISRLRFRELALHFCFFTTITSGPIARLKDARGLTDIYAQPSGMAAQIQTRQPRRILAPGLALMLIVVALIKVWWLSGWIGDQWVNKVFDDPLQYHSLEVLAAIYGYTVQLFFDFSGYSDLMIALGLLLGFRLPVNFRAPLLAHNIREFWNRWHISLSTWIRDYIYIPLGGNRRGFILTQVYLLIAMLLSGAWHGGSWHFVVWGLLHGLALMYLNITDWFRKRLSNKQNKLKTKSSWLGKLLGIFITIHFVCFSFVFFRAKTVYDAITVFRALFSNTINIPWSSNPLYFLTLLAVAWLIYPILAKAFNYLYQKADYLPRYSLILPLLLFVLLLLICAPSGIPGFIYANF